jgi:peroxiredoxin
MGRTFLLRGFLDTTLAESFGVFPMSTTKSFLHRNTVRLVQFLFIAGAAALAYSYVASARDGELRQSCVSTCAMAPDYVGNERPAPDFTLKTLDGTPFRLSEHRGKTVLLVFWNTACDACKQQMPALRKLAARSHADPSFTLLAVAVDESATHVAAVLERYTGVANPFPVALDPDSNVVGDQYGTKLFPEAWLIDATGTIRMRFDGPRDWSGPMVHDLIQRAASNSMCPLTIDASVAQGPGAAICSRPEH